MYIRMDSKVEQLEKDLNNIMVELETEMCSVKESMVEMKDDINLSNSQ